MFYEATARRRAFKSKHIFTTTMNNLCSQECFKLRSYAQHNVKLSITTFLVQQESMLRPERIVIEIHLTADTASFQLTKLFPDN